MWYKNPAVIAALVALVSAQQAQQAPQVPLDQARKKQACPDYASYSKYPLHGPFGEGPMALPFQRPAVHCRTFVSPMVESVIANLTQRMTDKDLSRLFENAFPNTLDTTVRWHVEAESNKGRYSGKWEGAQTFIVTGDINAEWLRDSTNQLAQYQPLAKFDESLFTLILGAINTQAEFVIASPYCNAFQPPPPSKQLPSQNGQSDTVHPAYEPGFVFECKYELDSLAAFLSLGNQFYNNTGSTEFLTKRWFTAVETVLAVIEEQSKGTFDKSGQFRKNEYTFQRDTNVGTETLNLGGVGNPLASDTGLIRSAFRPSDDATILGFLIPSNAQMAVELGRTAEMLDAAGGNSALAARLHARSRSIGQAIWEHGTVEHKRYGKIFAYEVDGYGSTILMDDTNVPSLLALPLLGFVDVYNEVYQNTRKMLLEKAGNPYFLQGRAFKGIGGPHVGLQHAWPMSLMVQSMTSNDDKEIMEQMALIKKASQLGLMHEGVNVNSVRDFTRSWFAWANSLFAQTILDIAQRKPHLLFADSKPFVIE